MSRTEQLTFEQAWNILGEVPLDKNECTMSVYLEIEEGTIIHDIWSFLEEVFPLLVIGDVLNGKTDPKDVEGIYAFKG